MRAGVCVRVHVGINASHDLKHIAEAADTLLLQRLFVDDFYLF